MVLQIFVGFRPENTIRALLENQLHHVSKKDNALATYCHVASLSSCYNLMLQEDDIQQHIPVVGSISNIKFCLEHRARKHDEISKIKQE